MGHLLERLQEYAGKDIYPYHMPGHKRRSWGRLPEALYGMDITEIDGFDNLHQPEGILRDAQREAAVLYGAEESFYLVNGSSCGILSAVSCALPFGGHILMARNCHKSAYHAAYLRRLAVSYVYPPILEPYDIFDGVEAEQIQDALEREPDIGAVLIVSPSYEGRIADVSRIARIVHQRGIPLIVDEAHGAHLGLAEGFPPNSCQAGADLVIHSVHKTLPSLTQTALLHVNGDRIDRERLRRFLRIYQSSSPSYLLMAGIDNALQYVGEEPEAFGHFKERYESMVGHLTEHCRYLRFLPVEDGKQDVGKLLVSVKGCSLSGRQLYDILLQKYHLQLEMAASSYVLAMFTVNDSEEAYQRMILALSEIDDNLGGENPEEEFCGTKAEGYEKRHSGSSAEDFKKRCNGPETEDFEKRCSGPETEDFEKRRSGSETESFEKRCNGSETEGFEKRCNGPETEDFWERCSGLKTEDFWERYSGPETEDFEKRCNGPETEGFWERCSGLKTEGFWERHSGPETEDFEKRCNGPETEGFEERCNGQCPENVEERHKRPDAESFGDRGEVVDAEYFRAGCKETDVEGSQEKRNCREKGQADEIPLAEAWDMETEMIPLEESVGRKIGEFINLYPPGVPLLVPGEHMTERLCGDIRNALEQGLQVQGIHREKRQGETMEMVYIPAIIH